MEDRCWSGVTTRKMSPRDKNGVESAGVDDPRIISVEREISMEHSIGDAIEKEAGMPVNILDVTFISVIRPHCVVPGRIV